MNTTIHIIWDRSGVTAGLSHNLPAAFRRVLGAWGRGQGVAAGAMTLS